MCIDHMHVSVVIISACVIGFGCINKKIEYVEMCMPEYNL